MYYHAFVYMQGWDEVWRNLTREALMREILIPFAHGQMTIGKRGWLINFRSARHIVFARTPEAIGANDDPWRAGATECTTDFINEVRASRAGPTLTSLLEKSFAPLLDQVFVIMKFGDSLLDSAYVGVIKPVLEEFNLRPLRIDEVQNSGKITDQALEGLAASRFVLADLSGGRPNCYYETGFAHAIGKEMVLTIRREDAIHFDLAGYRFIQWSTEAELRTQLRLRFTKLTENEATAVERRLTPV